MYQQELITINMKIRNYYIVNLDTGSENVFTTSLSINSIISLYYFDKPIAYEEITDIATWSYKNKNKKFIPDESIEGNQSK